MILLIVIQYFILVFWTVFAVAMVWFHLLPWWVIPIGIATDILKWSNLRDKND